MCLLGVDIRVCTIVLEPVLKVGADGCHPGGDRHRSRADCDRSFTRWVMPVFSGWLPTLCGLIGIAVIRGGWVVSNPSLYRIALASGSTPWFVRVIC